MVAAPPKPQGTQTVYAVETEESKARWQTRRAKGGLRNRRVHVFSVYERPNGQLVIRLGPNLVLNFPEGTTRADLFGPIRTDVVVQAAYESQGNPGVTSANRKRRRADARKVARDE